MSPFELDELAEATLLKVNGTWFRLSGFEVPPRGAPPLQFDEEAETAMVQKGGIRFIWPGQELTFKVFSSELDKLVGNESVGRSRMSGDTQAVKLSRICRPCALRLERMLWVGKSTSSTIDPYRN